MIYLMIFTVVKKKSKKGRRKSAHTRENTRTNGVERIELDIPLGYKRMDK